MSLDVEEESQIVDAQTYDLVSRFDEIAEAAGPHERMTPGERHEQLIESIRWVDEREFAFGLHVHVGVHSGDEEERSVRDAVLASSTRRAGAAASTAPTSSPRSSASLVAAPAPAEQLAVREQADSLLAAVQWLAVATVEGLSCDLAIDRCQAPRGGVRSPQRPCLSAKLLQIDAEPSSRWLAPQPGARLLGPARARARQPPPRLPSALAGTGASALVSMRTTLKRGVGRGAAVNGNGHSVLPPDALSAITRYRQPPPQRRRRATFGRVFFWVVAVLVMIAAGLLGGAYLFFKESVDATRARSHDVKVAQRQLASLPSPSEATIALVLGYDHRAGEESGLPSRSDTLMLLRADPLTKTVSMLSFPRDLLTEIYCPHRAPVLDRINAAYSECGSVGTLETVKHLTGLPINYLITVNFRGFKQIVNRLGGVWIDVDRRYYNKNTGTAATNYANINLMPGYQLLTGGSALEFVRYRHTDSDLYRLARQQMFVRALKEQLNHKLKGISVAYTLPRLVGALTSNVEVGVGGGGHYSGKTVLSYANFLYKLPPGHFFQAKIDNVTGYNELEAPQSSIDEAVQEFLNPNLQAGKQATSVALGQKPKVPVLQPGDTTVTVLNGNGVPGAAGNAAYLLNQRGYRILTPPSGKPANAPTWNYFRTKVYFDRTKPGARAAAQKLANLFGSADVGWIPAAIRPLSNGATIVVTVGQTFHGTLGPAPVDETPKPSPPLVIPAGEDTRENVLAAQRRVPFRLEVPTKIEHTSIPDPELPYSLYHIAPGHRAVRFVYRTGAREYWGIEETAYADAPVLADRSFRHVLDGRPFDLYYDGDHLHMIVLREHAATYWVVNTLLDSLSNETMIAIARGLRPVAR